MIDLKFASFAGNEYENLAAARGCRFGLRGDPDFVECQVLHGSSPFRVDMSEQVGGAVIVGAWDIPRRPRR